MSDNAYVSQNVQEVLYTTSSKARVSQTVVEVLYNSPSVARVTQNVIEVLRTSDVTIVRNVSVTSTADISQTFFFNLVKTINVSNTATVDQIISISTNFRYTNNPANVTLDGFDHYSSFTQPFKFFDQTQSYDWYISISEGRFGGGALVVRHGGFDATALKSDSNRGWYGFAIKQEVVPTGQQYFWRLATTTFDDWCTLGFLGGALTITRHDLILYNGPSIDLTTWNYIEIDGNNFFNLWINNAPVYWRGVSYPSPTPTQASQLSFTGTQKWIGLCVNGKIDLEKHTYFDDFYYSERQRLGPGYIETLFPYSDGQYTEWVHNGDISNWLSVADKPNIDYSVSIIVPNTSGDRNSVHLRGLTANTDIIVVTQLDVFANNNQDSGVFGSFKAYYYDPGDTVGSDLGIYTIIQLTGPNIENFNHYLFQIPVHPITPGHAWTPSELTSPEFGVVALTSNALSVTQIVLEVYRQLSDILPVGSGNINNVFVSNSLSVSQTIGLSKVANLFVTSSGILTQNAFVNSPRVISVSSQAYVTQTIYGINATIYISVTNVAAVHQTVIGRQGLYNVHVISTANVNSRFIRRDIITFITVVSTANIKQKFTSEYRLHVISTANIDQTYLHIRTTNQHFSHTSTLQNVYTPNYESIHYISDILTISNIYTHSGNYERNFQDTQILTDVFRSIILISDTGFVYDPYPVGPGQPPRIIPPHPVVTGTPVISTKETIIESLGGTIVLPAAEYGDVFGAKIQNNVKKTMTGRIYTYIRTQPIDRFTLTWVLGLQKALELASVIKNNNDNFLGPFNFYTLTLWNGQIWQAKMISADIPLTHDGRWQNSDNNNSEIEKMSVSVQFEGTQLL